MAPGRVSRSRSRRVSLPGVTELLRQSSRGPAVEDLSQASGREQHPHKITIYLSADELIALERARITLRGYDVTVDRGRIVREAIAVLVADLHSEGEKSLLARRLRSSSEA